MSPFANDATNPASCGSLCQPKETGSDTLLVAGFRTMALVALHRLYQRTCRDCGYHWTVTRAQKQKRMRQPVLRQRGVRTSRSLGGYSGASDGPAQGMRQMRGCSVLRTAGHEAPSS